MIEKNKKLTSDYIFLNRALSIVAPYADDCIV